jgi:hypothetical protein
MTEVQRETLRRVLAELEPAWFHHGDCLGADAEAHDIAVELGIGTHAHPSNLEGWRAFKKADIVEPPANPHYRNRQIVSTSRIMTAGPGGMAELQKGGTWSTVRFTRYVQVPLIIVWPDGTEQREPAR